MRKAVLRGLNPGIQGLPQPVPGAAAVLASLSNAPPSGFEAMRRQAQTQPYASSNSTV
jgi:hypothetical protein